MRSLRTCGECLTEYIEFLPGRYRKPYHSTIFLKEGGETDFQSLRLNHFAMTVPNMRACCTDEGIVREKSERLSGVNCLLYITLYKWKMSCHCP